MKTINKLIAGYALLLFISVFFLTINFAPKSKKNISITSSTLATSSTVQTSNAETYNVKFNK